jgi:hypothetical protein
MKKVLFITAIALGALTSCDKVENPYPPADLGISWGLYPNGDSLHYYTNVYTAFGANANVDRNILIEDFTGHTCNFCPAAAEEADDIKNENPGRVFVSGVHAGPNGTGTLQVLNPGAGYNTVFYNETTDELGNYFGNLWAGSLFTGNPFGTISRNGDENGTPMQGPQTWDPSAVALLTANDLKVNLQAQLNYFPSTRGVFLHVEADNIGAVSNELRIVVQLHQDSLIAPQKLVDNSQDPNYVHHDILRATLDNKTFGQELDLEHMDANGKYYFNYAYELPAEYAADNAHVLIYIRDAVTEEIYHVIEKHIE